MIYIGLFFTSKYVLERYIPIIPKKKSCTPLTKIIIQASDGQPPTGSPKAIVFIIITIIAMKAIKQNSNPTNADNTNGIVENARIPSKAYLNSLIKLNFDSPATLSGAS